MRRAFAQAIPVRKIAHGVTAPIFSSRMPPADPGQGVHLARPARTRREPVALRLRGRRPGQFCRSDGEESGSGDSSGVTQNTASHRPTFSGEGLIQGVNASSQYSSATMSRLRQLLPHIQDLSKVWTVDPYEVAIAVGEEFSTRKGGKGVVDTLQDWLATQGMNFQLPGNKRSGHWTKQFRCA